MTLPSVLVINEDLQIPLTELVFRFSRSGGKGGQNVNKVETKVELRFDVLHSESLTPGQQNLLYERLYSRIDHDGILVIVSQASRSQWKNRETAMERLVLLLRNALKPVRKRISTKPSRLSREKRLAQKKKRSDTKRMRRVREE